MEEVVAWCGITWVGPTVGGTSSAAHVTSIYTGGTLGVVPFGSDIGVVASMVSVDGSPGWAG